MNKDLERKHLRLALGAELADRFSDFERPDFILSTPDGSIGVEATSFFATSASAKLALTPGYEEQIKTDPSTIHRADLGVVEVLKGATLSFEKGAILADVVRQEVPSGYDVAVKFEGEIANKASKVQDYLSRCDSVNLVVNDDLGVLGWEDKLQISFWLQRVLRKQIFLECGFREIYLVSNLVEHGPVSLPIRGALFINDLRAYWRLTGSSTKNVDLLAACLHLDGYSTARIVVHRNFLNVRFGAWVVSLGNGQMQVASLLLDLRLDPHPAASQIFLRLDPKVVSEAERVIAERRNHFENFGMIGLIQESSSSPRSKAEDVRITLVEIDEGDKNNRN